MRTQVSVFVSFVNRQAAVCTRCIHICMCTPPTDVLCCSRTLQQRNSIPAPGQNHVGSFLRHLRTCRVLCFQGLRASPSLRLSALGSKSNWKDSSWQLQRQPRRMNVRAECMLQSSASDNARRAATYRHSRHQADLQSAASYGKRANC